ncbi:ISC system 2Fe-2S type ferredoxin [Aromatoleum toluvorans]|uniref:2Fe-2S ferredoxin n=1 Tax=Aromatoleum toluvorans TaxID=92002 RepID=A0ABX1Q3N9_9RHOO|nr:ISC system 2Fe-2S type ferredoxin [Aromatoleum toluvorans]NMG46258.1 ISC system 2Fe-2S type ferredoxin [Aromatoleum toluvorans]
MPRITLLPHAILSPEGAVFEAKSGAFLCDALLRQGVALEHACEKACACATCHVVIREGFASLAPASSDEEDQLDRAWGLQATSRLACQVVIRGEDLVVELPRYTRNLAREAG